MADEEKKCPTCGSKLIVVEGSLDQTWKSLPAIITMCSNPRIDRCGFKRWDRKPEKA